MVDNAVMLYVPLLISVCVWMPEGVFRRVSCGRGRREGKRGPCCEGCGGGGGQWL